MGKVAAAYNLMPEDADYPIERITEEIPKRIPKDVQVAAIEVKPLAFGLKVITATFVMQDAEGIVDRLEESLAGIPGLQSVETSSVTLI